MKTTPPLTFQKIKQIFSHYIIKLLILLLFIGGINGCQLLSKKEYKVQLDYQKYISGNKYELIVKDKTDEYALFYEGYNQAEYKTIYLPKQIEGNWLKEPEDGPAIFYRISAGIDQTKAAEKVQTLRHYNDDELDPLTLEINNNRVRLLLSMQCPISAECQVNNEDDPNHWLTQSAVNAKVILFDEEAESSLEPFPGSDRDSRRISIQYHSPDTKLFLTDTDGRRRRLGNMGDLTRIDGGWRYHAKPDGSSEYKSRYFRIDAVINTDVAKERINRFKSAFTAYQLKDYDSFTVIYIKDDDNSVAIYYQLGCRPEECVKAVENDLSGLSVLFGKNYAGVLLFEGKGEEVFYFINKSHYLNENANQGINRNYGSGGGPIWYIIGLFDWLFN
ncbi:hypothetical protein [Marinomonas primoryensis]|uniref:Uncharacterized protein n=1 Tax=Marinomonas primoryensis TaxID=178399 RepID=A0ABV0L0G5_9GAMM